MTLLGKVDGASAEDGTSYLNLASFIKSNGSNPKQDLEELWKRIAFNMLVSNTDDHLRNHGFILSGSGWRLSPLYDVNPTIYGDSLSLNVSQEDNLLDLDLVLETAEYYGLSHKQARGEVSKMQNIVKNSWIELAGKYGLNRSAIEYMKPAFELAEKII